MRADQGFGLGAEPGIAVVPEVTLLTDDFCGEFGHDRGALRVLLSRACFEFVDA